MFYFCICSHVKLPAVTKAVNRVTTKSQSEDSDLKIVEEETVEQKSMVCKRTGQKGGRGRGHKTQPKKTATKTKDEEVKPNTKQISVKDVSVMIKGLSQEELSPRKEIGDGIEIKEETEENIIELTWEQRLAQMHSISNFDHLQQYINSNPCLTLKVCQMSI